MSLHVDDDRGAIKAQADTHQDSPQVKQFEQLPQEAAENIVRMLRQLEDCDINASARLAAVLKLCGVQSVKEIATLAGVCVRMARYASEAADSVGKYISVSVGDARKLVSSSADRVKYISRRRKYISQSPRAYERAPARKEYPSGISSTSEVESSPPFIPQEQPKREKENGHAYWAKAMGTGYDVPGISLVNGAIVMDAAKRSEWRRLLQCDDARLDIALIDVRGWVQPNSGRPFGVQVESQLAKRVGAKIDQDARYDAAVAKRGPSVDHRQQRNDRARELLAKLGGAR